MSMQDKTADLLTRVRNACMVKHDKVVLPFFKFGFNLCKLLKDQGYINDVSSEGEGSTKKIVIDLKYDKRTSQPVIGALRRVSRPGLRRYSSVSDIPRVQGGLGIMVVSTSLGELLTDHQARQKGVGGELICEVETD